MRRREEGEERRSRSREKKRSKSRERRSRSKSKEKSPVVLKRKEPKKDDGLLGSKTGGDHSPPPFIPPLLLPLLPQARTSPPRSCG